MAAQDIMPFRDPHGGYGAIEHYPMKAGETFLVGEPVAIDATGNLTESAPDPLGTDIVGIALAPGGASFNNPKTGAVYATGDLIPVCVPNQDTIFITKNWSVAGTAFDDTAPAVTNIGDEAGLSLISGEWGVDISQTNNTVRIVDILDSLKRSILETGGTITVGTTYYILFKIIAHQSTSTAAVAAPI